MSRKKKCKLLKDFFYENIFLVPQIKKNNEIKLNMVSIYRKKKKKKVKIELKMSRMSRYKLTKVFFSFFSLLHYRKGKGKNEFKNKIK